MIPDLVTLLRKVLVQEASDERIPDFRSFVRVEVGLRLLEVLGLSNEAPIAIWALLQGHELPAIKALCLNDYQRRYLANFRAVTHQYSENDWLENIEAYADLPEDVRVYQVALAEKPGEGSFVRTGRQEFRIRRYDEVMEKRLEHRTATQNPIKADTSYLYRIPDGQYAQVSFPKAVLQAAKAKRLPDFPERKTVRAPYRYTYAELLQIAGQLDALESERGWQPPSQWVNRLDRMMRYRAMRPDGSLAEPNAEAICIDGMTHIPGMVGAGKSTVAALIAADFYRTQRGRIVLIAPDVPDVLRQVAYFNSVLSTHPDHPAAVPLVGFSERDTHLHKLFGNEHFDAFAADATLRYLDTTCLVTSWLSEVDETRKVRSLTPGKHEPCEKLLDAAECQKQMAKSRSDEAFESRTKQYLCPLLSICPMHQVYHDLVAAQIWVTTAGAIAQGHVPIQVDPRGVTLWMLLYEQADLIIFDEMDASQSWFDGLFAPELSLDDSQTSGLLPQAFRKMGDQPSGSWRRSPDVDRWRQSFDLTTPLTRNLLGMIESDEPLRRWLTRLPYSPVRVIEDLAQRLSWRYLWYGDEEHVPAEIDQLYHQIRDALIRVARDELDTGPDLSSNLALPLHALASTIALEGRSQISRTTRKITQEIIRTARAGISHLQETIEERLKNRAYYNYLLSQGTRLRKTSRAEDMEPLGEKAMVNRLEFVLTVIALDNALRGVFYGWASVVDLLGDEYFPPIIPRSMIGLVPVPPIGQWRGFRTMPATDGRTGGSLTLSTFEYAGVGRQILARFPRLMTEMDGLPGPHVLAMSGTSYLEKSSRFHVNQPPAGVLEPPQNVQAAIRDSRMAFIPQSHDDHRLISVSGTGDQMEESLSSLTRRLATVPSRENSLLVSELQQLKRMGEANPDRWGDRDRIILMVNSYSQARNVARYLHATLPAPYNNRVFHLGRSGDEGDIWMLDQRILRSEVEARAAEAQILVAPMGSLGRGYNLVSPSHRHAAFGSIYFLIRPMTPPHDALEMVAGINAFLDRILSDPTSEISQVKGVYEQMRLLRQQARFEWEMIEQHQQYRSMPPDRKLGLGANTASLIIQACGRLVRGGVPFNAYFVDAAWVQPEEGDGGDYLAHPSHSMLAAVAQVLNELSKTTLGDPLYGAFAHAIANTRGVEFHFEKK